MSWDIRLEEYHIAIGRFGSLIAAHQKFSTSSKSIEIFSGSGNLICSMSWPTANGSVAQIGWSRDDLVVVSSTGFVRRYFNFEGDFDSFSLDLAPSQSVRDVCFSDTGVVVRLFDGSFIAVTNYETGTKRRFSLGEETTVTSWILGSETSIFVSSLSSIFELDFYSKPNLLCEESAHTLAVSENGNFMAYLCFPDNILKISTRDFNHVLAQKQFEVTPISIQWCSNDAVAVVFTDEIRLIGPSTASLTFYYDSTPVVRTEVDGAVILSDKKIEFLSTVDDATSSTFRIGSTSPSAILVDSIDQLENQSPRAGENLNMIKPSMGEALECTLRAASEEFDPYWQKKLLRAVVFGKSYLGPYNCDSYVSTCDSLRVLNAIRQPEVGLFLTFTQFQDLGKDALIEMLLKRKLHQLCYSICSFLNMSSETVYIDWACCKIKKNSEKSDSELLAAILDKIKPTMSFEKISMTAYQEGRTQLSATLLNHEPNANKQIPLLFQMELDELALTKAEESGNTDLLTYSLLVIQQKVTKGDFFRLLKYHKISQGVFIDKFVRHDEKLAKDFYYQIDELSEVSELHLLNVYKDVAARHDALGALAKNYKKQRVNETNARLVGENLSLLTLQDSLSKQLQEEFRGLTLNGTLLKLVELDQLKRAFSVQKQFKVAEKKLWWLVIDKLSEQENWVALYDFAKSKKSPIGYVPFFKKSIAKGEKRQAGIYVEMCGSQLGYEQKVNMLLEAEDYKKVLEEAFSKRDLDLIDQVESKGNSVIRNLCREYRERIR